MFNVYFFSGRFNFSFVTVEHFEPTSLASGDVQFSGTAWGGSRESLLYLSVDPYHYFSPSIDFLKGRQLSFRQIDLHKASDR